MTWLFTLFLMLAVIAIMSVGVVITRKPIKGSCGGLANIGVKERCEICGVTPEQACGQQK